MSEYNDVVLVSCLWVLMAYVQMPAGPICLLFGKSEGQKKWGERIFLNQIEQAPLFLTSLWSFAYVISPERAATLGKFYLAFRSLYAPIWLFLGGEAGVPPHITISTFPQYGINVYTALSVVLKVGFEKDLMDTFGSDVKGLVVCIIAYFVFVLGVTPKVMAVLSVFFDQPVEVETKKKD